MCGEEGVRAGFGRVHSSVARVLDYYVTDASSYAVTYVTVVPMISRSLLAITISLEAPVKNNTTE